MNKHIPRKNSLHEGVTLIELLMTIALLAIILAIAVPGFETLSKNNRLRNQTNDFYTSLALARNEALKRFSRVTLCPSANGLRCTPGQGWEQGWIIFNDIDDDGEPGDPGESVLYVGSRLSGGNTLRGNRSVSSYISYIGNGYSRKTNGAFQAGTLVLCDDRGLSEGRAIIISSTGRPRVVRAVDSSATRVFQH